MAISIDEKAVFIDEKAVLIDEKAVLIDEKFDDRPMVFIDEKVDDYHVFLRHLLDEKAGIDAKSSILVESLVTLNTKNARG